MRHHRVVDEHDAQALAVGEPQRLGIGELDAVERPGEPLHVAGQVQLDRARRLAAVGIVERARQIRVGQHAPAVVAQADAGIVELRRRRRRLHVDERIAAVRSPDATASPAGVAACVAGMSVRRRACPACVVGRQAPVHASCPMPPWPMSAIVSSGRGSSAGTGARRPCAHGQRAGGEAGAIHRLREDREGVLPRRLDDHVEGLGDGDAELVDGHRAARAGRRRRRPSSSARECARRSTTSPSR